MIVDTLWWMVYYKGMENPKKHVMEKIVPFGAIVPYEVKELVRVLLRQPKPYRFRGEHLTHRVDSFARNYVRY